MHKLKEIIFISVAATVCRCNEWHEMKDWALAKEEWLRKYLKLPNEIPS